MKYYYNKLMYKITGKEKYKNFIVNSKRTKEIINNIDWHLNSLNNDIKSSMNKFVPKSYGEMIGEEIKKNFGKHSYACEGFYSYSKNTKVGAFCSIGQNVTLSTSHHPIDFLTTSPFTYFEPMKLEGQNHLVNFDFIKPVTIGNDVWIGNNVIVLDGINIGDGAIIGAGAVVTKNVPPYAIVAGVPAKIIKYRFTQDIIKELLMLKWWEKDDDIIANLPFDNIKSCIDKLKMGGE